MIAAAQTSAAIIPAISALHKKVECNPILCTQDTPCAHP
jgi:hypothetical protein